MLISRDAFRGRPGFDPLVHRVLDELDGAPAGPPPRTPEREGPEEVVVPTGDGRPSRGDEDEPLEARLAEVSRLVQRGLLPRAAPSVRGWDVAAGTTTEEGGRGDTVWDWLRLGTGEVVLLALDVQGQGLPPSHQLVAARVLMRALAAEHDDPTEILPRANAALSRARIGGADQFVECGTVLLREEGLEWASAGRVPACVLRRGGEVEELGAQGPPLGMSEGFRYASRTVPMAAGDVFVVLSQGSIGVLRGAADLVAKIQQRPAGEVVETLHLALSRARGEGEPRETSVLFARKH